MWPGRDPQPWAVRKWALIDRLHWTPDEAEALTVEDYYEGTAVLDAIDKVHEARRNASSSA